MNSNCIRLPLAAWLAVTATLVPAGAVRADASGFAQSAAIPQNLGELWAGFDEFDKATPLDVEVLKEWEQDGIVCRLVRYQVGVFKGAPARVAAFYAFPKGGTKLPAILEMHGGGQSAGLDGVTAWAKRGYAALSLNWGGNKPNFGRSKETYDGPQTDWGKLDATHPPQRNKSNHFAGSLAPDEYTLDAVESPRNSNWFLVLTAARRALSFLQQQPEVDPARLGACGHSMGGKLTTDLAGIDPRVKAAVPSCGGSGDILESQTDLPGCSKSRPTAMELACVSDNAYIPRIACPVLWLSPANDFHAHIDHMAWNWRNVPDERLRFSIAPHLNHRHTDEHAITQYLWFEQHLKGAFTMPRTPKLALNLKTADGVPTLTATPDDAMVVKRVDLYYSVDPHELTRFWRDAGAVKSGGEWKAACPVMSLDQPVFAYANVYYDLPARYRNVAQAPGQDNTDMFAISSRVLSAGPAQLQAAGVKATDKPERSIDDGARGWHDWYRLNWGHPPLWHAFTRKLTDPKWRGPDGARLLFEIQCAADNTLVVTFNCNGWGVFQPGKPAVDYSVARELKGAPGWQTISVSLEDLAATDPKVTLPLANWQTVTEFSIGPSGEVVKDGQKTKVEGKAWQGPREIRNLRWEGGEYTWQTVADSTLSAEEHQKLFNDAIKKSLEQEKMDRLAAAAALNSAKPGYGLIACDVDTHEITKFDADGKLVWVYDQIRAIDAWPMPDGSVLAAYLPSPLTAKKGGVRLIGADKKTVFDYPYDDEIMSCQPLPDAHILVNECDAGRITEIDRTGKALRSFDVKAKGKGHQTARLIRLTPQNTILVGECYSHKLREYDRGGQLIKEWDLTMAYSASRLANGNTLISGYKPAQLAEVDPAGKTVWTLTAEDLPAELNIGSFCESTRLPNGNTLVACASRSSKPGPRVVFLEVTPDKKIVWKQMEPSRTREITALKPIPNH